ncbi:MAG TPA: DUF262 domain-containing protein [Firmicutes bacterium]|nr:DUF262 domain-containing protein [Bacillota bacterium]
MNYSDRIKPTDKSIYSYLEDLLKRNYQIPTFQREVVWEKENVKKLWDSIYKFYPLGSVLIWKTDLQLQNHREIGGHIISDDDFNRVEYQYILDGQQRTTSLLTSIYGGQIEGKKDFDPTLYIDLTVEDIDEIDDESYKKRFLFWEEIDDDNGRIKANYQHKKRYEQGLILKLKDIKENYGDVERKLIQNPEGGYKDYNDPVWVQLRKIKEVLDNYRISLIELKGIQVSEVCQIFERINQAGKPLNIFDIVVAKTFRPSNHDVKGFYLRELINDFRSINQSNYMQIDDLTYLQILAVLINKTIDNSGVLNITDRYLNNVRAEQIERVWDRAKVAILKTFDFFENHLRLKGPQLIPFRYFYMTVAFYFYENPRPDYNFINKYFWYYSFHRDDLLSNTTHLWKHISFLEAQKEGQNPAFDRFLIDKNSLRTASYSSRGRLSRAILSLFASRDPRDWANPNRSVLSDVYYILTDKPNLHHVFPLNYIEKNKGANSLDSNSLMNIVYLTQITNLRISDKNPMDYLKDYDCQEFENVLSSHLLPSNILTWARMDEMPDNALDIFIDTRIDYIINDLKQKLQAVKFEVIDTAEKE